jgi:hypothetical protein
VVISCCFDSGDDSTFVFNDNIVETATATSSISVDAVNAAYLVDGGSQFFNNIMSGDADFAAYPYLLAADTEEVVVVDNVKADALIGVGNTLDPDDYGYAAGSPAIGAATDNGNCGFAVGEVEARRPMKGEADPYPGKIRNGLEGQWLFGDGSGATAADTGEYGRHATLQNMEAEDWVAAMGPGDGGALQFDAVNEYLTLAGNLWDWDFIMRTGVFSICQWIKVDSFAAINAWIGSAISGTSIGFSTAALTDKRIRIYSRNQSAQSVFGWTGSISTSGYFSGSNHLPDTDPHFVCITGDGTTCSLFVDNMATAVGTTSISNLATTPSTRTINIGRVNNATTLVPLLGKLGQVRIYNRMLSADERLAIKEGRG